MHWFDGIFFKFDLNLPMGFCREFTRVRPCHHTRQWETIWFTPVEWFKRSPLKNIKPKYVIQLKLNLCAAVVALWIYHNVSAPKPVGIGFETYRRAHKLCKCNSMHTESSISGYSTLRGYHLSVTSYQHCYCLFWPGKHAMILIHEACWQHSNMTF